MPRKTVPNPTKQKLFSGGSPQIAKGYGDAPVQAYIAATPGGCSGPFVMLASRLAGLLFATFADFLVIALTLPRAAWADTAARTCKDR